MLFSPLINVKNANNCWHFNIFEQEKISYSVELSMKKVLKPRDQTAGCSTLLYLVRLDHPEKQGMKHI